MSPTKLFTGPVFTRLKKHLENTRARDANWEYELGRLVEELCPLGQGEYGQNLIQELARQLSGDRVLTNRLWNARKCFHVFSRSLLDDLLRQAAKSGFELTPSHLKLLASIDKAPQREAISRRCIAEKMTIKRLRQAVLEIRGKKGGGRAPLVRPASPEEAVRDMNERAADWVKRFQSIWFGSPDAILAGNAKKPTKKLAAEIEASLDQLKALRDAADEALALLHKRQEP